MIKSLSLSFFFVIFCSVGLFSQSTINCTPNFGNNIYDTYITNVQFAGINNSHTTTAGSPDYTYFQNIIAQVEQCQSYTFRCNSNVFSTRSNKRVYIDFDGDGTFNQANEVFNLGTAGGVRTTQISIPNNAKVGLVRMRVIANEQAAATPCVNDTYGEAEDYQVNIAAGPDMAFVSANTTQVNGAIAQGATRQAIVKTNIVTSGCQPFSVDRMDFALTGTNNLADIETLELYYNNTDNFAGATQVSNTIATIVPNLSFTIATNEGELAIGNNYFWLAADISADAVNGNFIDAEVLEISSTDNGGSVNTPANANPAGARELIFQHCIPAVNAAAAGADFELNRYTIGAFSSRAGADGFNSTSARGYNNFSNADSLTLCGGARYAFTANTTNGNTALAPFVHVWADWNQDGDFEDENEHQLIGSGGLATGGLFGADANSDYTAEIFVPEFAKNGLTVARVGVSPLSTSRSCGNFTQGEFDDILINVKSLESHQEKFAFNETGASLTLSTQAITNGYNWQESTDLMAYNDMPGTVDAPSIMVNPEDNVKSYRLRKDDAACLADVNVEQSMFSDLTEVLRVGFDSLQASPAELCEGDSSFIKSYYRFKSASFSNDVAAPVEGQGVAYSSQINVANTEILSAYALNGVCITATASLIEDWTFELLAPNGTKILLSDGASANDANRTYSFCLRQDSNAVKIENETAALDGTYQPVQNFGVLTGTAANGNWTLRVLSSNANVAGTIQSWSLDFGYNNGISWEDAGVFANPMLDSSMAQVNNTQFFTASLNHRLLNGGAFLDSVQVIARSVVNTNIQEIVSNDGDLLICPGDEKHFRAQLNNPVLGDNYSWFLNDVEIVGEVTDSITLNTLVEGDELKVEFNLTDACGTIFTADSVVLIERQLEQPALALQSSVLFPLCEVGSDFTVNADYTDTNRLSTYSWQVNGTEVAQKVNTFDFSGLSNGDILVVEVTNNACGASAFVADSIRYRITQRKDIVANLIADSAYCVGAVNLQYDTTGNDAASEDFFWIFNGTDTISFEDRVNLDTLEAGTYNIKVEYFPADCFNSLMVSEELNFEILEFEDASFDISADKDVLCLEQGTVIRAENIQNAGINPKFQWFQDGNELKFETKDSLVILNQFVSRDYSVELTSDFLCPLSPVTQSNTVTIDVQRDDRVIGLDIQSTNTRNGCVGDSILINSSFDSGSPDHYFWLANGDTILGENNALLNTARDSGTIKIQLFAVSNLVCSGLDTVVAGRNLTFNNFTTPDSLFTVNIEDGEFIARSNEMGPSTTVKWFLNGLFIAARPTITVEFTQALNELCMVVDNGNTCFAQSCQSFDFTDVNQIANNPDNVAIYPNPASTILNLKWNGNQAGTQYKILDAQGKMLTEKVLYESSIDISALAKGSYLLMLNNGHDQVIKRFEKL